MSQKGKKYEKTEIGVERKSRSRVCVCRVRERQNIRNKQKNETKQRKRSNRNARLVIDTRETSHEHMCTPREYRIFVLFYRSMDVRE